MAENRSLLQDLAYVQGPGCLSLYSSLASPSESAKAASEKVLNACYLVESLLRYSADEARMVREVHAILWDSTAEDTRPAGLAIFATSSNARVLPLLQPKVTQAYWGSSFELVPVLGENPASDAEVQDLSAAEAAEQAITDQRALCAGIRSGAFRRLYLDEAVWAAYCDIGAAGRGPEEADIQNESWDPAALSQAVRAALQEIIPVRLIASGTLQSQAPLTAIPLTHPQQ